MPIKYKNEKTRRTFERNNTLNCFCNNCGKQISGSVNPEITESMYCLECKLKYPKQIRKKRMNNKC